MGIGCLHEKNIAHRNLRLDNIFIDEDGFIKLIDFGLARKLGSEEELAGSRVGTPQYMAPEVYEGTGHGLAVDWWAVGIIIFELIFGNHPFFSSVSYEKMAQRIVAAKPIFPNREKYKRFTYSREVEDIIKRLLTKDQSKRLGSKGGY